MSKINILEHKLVPNHEIMSDSEICKELGSVDFDIENLPKIKIEDPVVKDIKAIEGDILRITRNSDTAGTFVTYRIVECASRYEIMDDSEIEIELTNSDFDFDNIPKIKVCNPFVKSINAEIGDILRITRGSEETNNFVSYAKVIED